MNMREWAVDAINSPKTLAIPIMTHPGIEILGKRIVDAVTDGEIHAAAVVALNERYPAAASTVIMDLTVEAEAFGAEVVFADHEVPNVVGRLLSSVEDIEALQIPSLDAGRVPEYIKANRLVAEAINDKPTFGGCIGPFSLAGRLFDMTEVMMAIFTEPESVKILLEKCTTFIKSYIAAIKSCGVSGVIIAEPAAGLLSNEDSTEYSSIYIKQIVEELQSDDFMIVLHNCGNAGHSTDSMVVTGAAAMHFGNQIDMVEAIEACPSDIIAMGNLDPVSVMQQSTPEEVAAATRNLLDRMSGYKNFVLSTGCDTPPGVSFENIEAFYSQLD